MKPSHIPPHRPPWWPENEGWPPAGPPWLKMRRFFFWRIIGIVIFLALLMAGAGLVALVTFGRPSSSHGPPPFLFCGGFVAVLMGVVLLARLLQRVTTPVGELMEAVGRVGAGDYAVRAVERGPAEVRALIRAFNAMAERLELNETQRRNLLADVTHELRTPLTVIQGNLEGLLDGVYPRDDAHLGPILEDTRVLARLIDDLRTLSLVASGALQLHREPTDLIILVNETLSSFRAQAQAAGVELSPAITADLPLLDVDPVRIREVLANLITNALHYTPPGGRIQLTAKQEEQHVQLCVRDTGTGIAPEALPHIFDRFYKSNHSGGTGLGLAIAKNLINAHGGEISVQSQPEPERGTMLCFTLPS